MKAVDITGQKFNKLTAKKLVEIKKVKNGTRHYWLYKCDCGNEIVLQKNNVSNNHTQSCGCYQRQQTSKANTTHNLYYTRIYKIYRSMLQRCFDSNVFAYKDYGGRGITVCDEWKNDFMNFYNWSMNNGYSNDLSIDRIDNNGNYCPDNCRWVNRKTQARNTRSNKYITYKGEKHCVSEWAEILKIDGKLLGERLRLRWSFDRAINTSPEVYKNRANKLIEYNGQYKTKEEWIESLQIHPTTFYRRLKRYQA